MAMGALWGFMPCGLVYSALAWSAATATGPFDGAFLMGLFGMGTLPAMLGTTLVGQQASVILRHQVFRNLMGMTLIVMGSWSLWLTTPLSGHGMMPMTPSPQHELAPPALDHSGHHQPSSSADTAI